jgi:hypothetical protein
MHSIIFISHSIVNNTFKKNKIKIKIKMQKLFNNMSTDNTHTGYLSYKTFKLLWATVFCVFVIFCMSVLHSLFFLSYQLSSSSEICNKNMQSSESDCGVHLRITGEKEREITLCFENDYLIHTQYRVHDNTKITVQKEENKRCKGIKEKARFDFIEIKLLNNSWYKLVPPLSWCYQQQLTKSNDCKEEL